MKFARLFLATVLLCIFLSAISSILMVKYVWGDMKMRSAIFGTSNTAAETQNLDTGKNSQSQNSNSGGNVSQSLVDLETSVKSLASKASPSVVSIVINKEVQTYRTDPFGFFYEPAGTIKQKVGGGTGFFVSKDGYILTNKHVVSDPKAEYTIILADGKELIGKVLAYDPVTDLAVIRAFSDAATPYTNASPLGFVTSQSQIGIGSFVVAIGNALAEFQNTVTFGVVSGLGRQIEASDGGTGGVEALSGLIQTDTAINPGNSGGPLVNLEGKVIGINTAISAGANGIGFAIPLSERVVDAMMKSVIKYGQIKRSFLGVRYIPLNKSIATALGASVSEGAYIGGGSGVSSAGGTVATGSGSESVVAGSPAASAGFQAGDIITEIDGKSLNSGYGLRDALSEKLPGDSVTLKVIKKATGKTEVATVQLGES